MSSVFSEILSVLFISDCVQGIQEPANTGHRTQCTVYLVPDTLLMISGKCLPEATQRAALQVT